MMMTTMVVVDVPVLSADMTCTQHRHQVIMMMMMTMVVVDVPVLSADMTCTQKAADVDFHTPVP